MSVGLPSDEVAEDYKNSLEDLAFNSRYEISNLTVIAKENTEHAMAISRVLENHIRNTPPDRKLPAMYVLDSIVKNVGTPYTLFLGRNLYHTFMNAYTLVNSQIRRKLDEMLRTWKEPVPGSLDTKPVFPPDITRPIENALIKARTAAVQQNQQQQFRSQQEMMAQMRGGSVPNGTWRSTPTPPQVNGQYRPPGQIFPQQNFPPQSFPPPQNYPNGHQQIPTPYQQYPRNLPPRPVSTTFHQPFQQHTPQPPQYSQIPGQNQDLQLLHRDIDGLIRKAKDEFAANIHDTSVQTRLKALLDLQGLMQQQQLPPHEIQMIRDQVNALSRPTFSPPTSVTPAYNFPHPSTPQPSFPQNQPVQPGPPPIPQATDLQALLSSNNLAEIIAKAQRATPTPPLPSTSVPVMASISAPTAPAPASTPVGGLDLMASLRAAGLLPADPTTPRHDPLSHLIPSAKMNILSKVDPVNKIELTPASLKIPRPQLLTQLYEARPNNCTTCGRRFLANDEGREKKARHLDWHFRTNQRLADAAKRGQSRSWYVDELDWIKSRDDPEGTMQSDSLSATAGAGPSNTKSTSMDPRSKYIPVPSDQTLANLPCPICQEKFDTTWSDEAQDFVWVDAVRVGGRIYHASCHSDISRDGGSTPIGHGRTGTPDSVLGKRKAGV